MICSQKVLIRKIKLKDENSYNTIFLFFRSEKEQDYALGVNPVMHLLMQFLLV